MAANRSRVNPFMVLFEAIDRVRTFFARFGDEPQSRDAIARFFRYTNAKSGPAVRLMAGLGHFDLLEKRGNKLAVSTLAKDILRTEDEDGDAALLYQQAFLAVDVYREYLEACRESGAVSETVESDLIALGIAENAAEHVASLFFESAVQARVISPNGRLLIWQDTMVPEATEPISITLPLLRGRQARLVLPPSLTKKDIDILRAQVSVLEMHLSEAQTSPTIPFRKRAASSG